MPANPAPLRVAAIDLGASSGRVSVVEVGEQTLRSTCVHRFDTTPAYLDARLAWDIVRIYADIEAGLAAAASIGGIDAVGVDAWGCDYGLIGSTGDLTGLPLCYRDGRTLTPDAAGCTAVDRVHAVIGPAALYTATGTQYQPFNTIYQLAADADRIRADDTVAMIPDLIVRWLTGQMVAEVTSLSTTGLIDPVSRRLAPWLPGARYISRQPPLEPGTLVGPITPQVAGRTGMARGTPIVAVASHDTASAVAAVPATTSPDNDWAYIVSGTWSLVGVELARPVMTPAGRAANFTNELGVAGTVRFLRNITGLWVLNECVRAWQEAGADIDLFELVDAAAAEPPGGLFDIDDASLLAAGADMPDRVAHLMATHHLAPTTITRAILDSLARAYAQAVARAGDLSGHRIGVVHLVGGGCQNALLCQLTADATGMPVIAGHVEASTLGNALVQAWALCPRTLNRHSSSPMPAADLAGIRGLIAGTQPLVTYTPRTSHH